ncbi:predicted protein [Chaetoceros tenuissimus]|uniref:Uncharacterized protein n=1 Tax=Chaetoceros tenuissimus TaxID=426638 RepID=A0AAD3D9S7_9STRA|nr:predicted protein [Chaetoceros tenuissimus]
MIYRSNTFCSLLLASTAIFCTMKQVRSKSVLRFDRKHRAANIMSSNEFGLVTGHEKSLMNIEEEASYMKRVLGDSSYSDGSKCDLSVSAKCFLLDEEKTSCKNYLTYLNSDPSLPCKRNISFEYTIKNDGDVEEKLEEVIASFNNYLPFRQVDVSKNSFISPGNHLRVLIHEAEDFCSVLNNSQTVTHEIKISCANSGFVVASTSFDMPTYSRSKGKGSSHSNKSPSSKNGKNISKGSSSKSNLTSKGDKIPYSKSPRSKGIKSSSRPTHERSKGKGTSRSILAPSRSKGNSLSKGSSSFKGISTSSKGKYGSRPKRPSRSKGLGNSDLSKGSLSKKHSSTGEAGSTLKSPSSSKSKGTNSQKQPTISNMNSSTSSKSVSKSQSSKGRSKGTRTKGSSKENKYGKGKRAKKSKKNMKSTKGLSDGKGKGQMKKVKGSSSSGSGGM